MKHNENKKERPVLRIWMGLANTGKSARVLERIERQGERTGALLLSDRKSVV